MAYKSTGYALRGVVLAFLTLGIYCIAVSPTFIYFGQDSKVARLPEGDHRHLALFSASDLDALVTCNLKDLANQFILEAVRKVNHAEGIDKEIRSGPPEAFLLPPPA
jgi:hypothetical protein